MNSCPSLTTDAPARHVPFLSVVRAVRDPTLKYYLQVQPPAGRMHNRVIRGVRVMLDSDLAALYGVPTKRLNEQVKRNARRFPEDFCFQLTAEEVESLAGSGSQNVTLKGGSAMRSQIATASKRNVRFLPYAFTEHGAIMAANVLNSEAATALSVAAVRAFVQLPTVVSPPSSVLRFLRDLLCNLIA